MRMGSWLQFSPTSCLGHPSGHPAGEILKIFILLAARALPMSVQVYACVSIWTFLANGRMWLEDGVWPLRLVVAHVEAWLWSACSSYKE